MIVRHSLFATCVVVTVGCANTQNSAVYDSSPCGQIKKLAFTKDGMGYVDPAKAIEVLSACDAATASPSSPAAARASLLVMRGRAYEQQSLHNKALADLEESLRIRPARTAWDVIEIASDYRKSGQSERALTLLRKMLDDRLGVSGKGTSPGMPSYYHLGITLIELGRWFEAAEALTEGLTYQTDYPWAYFYRGLAYSKMNDTENAKKDVVQGRKLVGALSGDQLTDANVSLAKEPFATLLEKFPE